MNYTYTKQQYKDTDIRMEGIVKAEYAQSETGIDSGNPLIEALPKITDSDLKKFYKVPAAPVKDPRKLSQFGKMSYIEALRGLRCPLPFYVELERKLHLALIASYRERSLTRFGKEKDTVMVEGVPEEISFACRTTVGTVNSAGFHMIGFAGCGKSTAMAAILDTLPTAILHQDDDSPDETFIQIPCVYLSVYTNGNMAALLEAFGRYIDRVLGNVEPFYEEQIGKRKTIGKKAQAVERLIEKFAVGCLILDEIQLMNFDGTEKSFETLLTIVNNTKVALAVIGTEDAYSKMFPNARTARRTGAMIPADEYRTNKGFLNVLIGLLLRYSVFDESLSDRQKEEITLAIIECSKGIVNQIISLYSYMQFDYITSASKPVIDAEYVRVISRKYFPGLIEHLANFENAEEAKAAAEIINRGDRKLEELLAGMERDNTADMITDMITDNEVQAKQAIKSEVISGVKSAFTMFGKQVRVSTIESAVQFVMEKYPDSADVQTLSRDAIKHIQDIAEVQTEKPKKKKKKQPDQIVLKNELENCMG